MNINLKSVTKIFIFVLLIIVAVIFFQEVFHFGENPEERYLRLRKEVEKDIATLQIELTSIDEELNSFYSSGRNINDEAVLELMEKRSKLIREESQKISEEITNLLYSPGIKPGTYFSSEEKLKEFNDYKKILEKNNHEEWANKQIEKLAEIIGGEVE